LADWRACVEYEYHGRFDEEGDEEEPNMGILSELLHYMTVLKMKGIENRAVVKTIRDICSVFDGDSGLQVMSDVNS